MRSCLDNQFLFYRILEISQVAKIKNNEEKSLEMRTVKNGFTFPGLFGTLVGGGVDLERLYSHGAPSSGNNL